VREDGRGVGGMVVVETENKVVAKPGVVHCGGGTAAAPGGGLAPAVAGGARCQS
jgi:hypothetical protein